MILIFQRYRDILLENIDYDVLIQNPQIDQERLAFYQSALLLNLDQTQLDNLFCNNARRLFNA